MNLNVPEGVSVVRNRVQGIDVLRGLCIVAVVLHHINLRIRFNESAIGKAIGPAANRVLFWSGYYGVRVFFVISGFLIASWTLKRWGRLQDISVKQFYSMRFARIVPCLAGLLLLLSVLDRAGVPRFTVNTLHTSLGRALLAALTFHINWLEARTGYLPAAWDVLWSLSVEEVFYIAFPLVCAWLRNRVLLTAALAAFVVAGPFARVLTRNEMWADYGYLACMDGIALGCLAAMLAAKARFGRRSLAALQISGGILCALIVVFRGTAAALGFYKAGLDVTVLGIGTALLVIAFQQTSDHGSRSTGLRPALLWATGPLRWFGRNSYEVYLTHMLVVWPMVGLFFHFGQTANAALPWFVATTTLTGLAGYAVARFYSEPFNLKLRTRLFGKRTRQAALAGSEL